MQASAQPRPLAPSSGACRGLQILACRLPRPTPAVLDVGVAAIPGVRPGLSLALLNIRHDEKGPTKDLTGGAEEHLKAQETASPAVTHPRLESTAQADGRNPLLMLGIAISWRPQTRPRGSSPASI